MSKVALAKISSLTFYKDAETKARRSSPIPQLTCIGKACQLYTPDAVRCTNVGGSGTEVDWQCEADLPEALRFGRVEVSCEGWSGPGDPYVLKGSCGLEYRLVHVPDALRKESDHRLPPSFASRLYHAATADPSVAFFYILWVALLIFILYTIVKSCLWGNPSPNHPNRPRSSTGPGGPSSTDHRYDPPPPYTKRDDYSDSQQRRPGWEPGFWTGVGLGGLGGYFLNNRRQRDHTYDWERVNTGRFERPTAYTLGPRIFSTSRRQAHGSDFDRGEGSSSLGSMRRATGLGGSNVR